MSLTGEACPHTPAHRAHLVPHFAPSAVGVSR